MHADSWQPTAPMVRTEQITRWAREHGSVSALVIADPAVVEQSVTHTVRSALAAAGWNLELTLAVETDSTAIRDLAVRIRPGQVVVSVGGGTTLDLAKLATLTAHRPEAVRWTESNSRGGLVALPASLGDRIRVLAVPTTLGTGSERGAVACYTHRGYKRLAAGLCLRPFACVYLAEATQSLSASLVSDGMLEALFRTTAPYIGDPTVLPDADPAAEELTRRLVTTGYEIADRLRAGQPVPADLRLNLAALSGESQLGSIHHGRSPYMSKAWPIANELSTYLGIPKMRALPPVWAGVWARIRSGEGLWGARDRLAHMWQHVIRSAAPHLDSDPVRGLLRLMDDWHVDPTLTATAAQVDAVARRSVRAWGAGLPHLAGLSTADIRRLLAESTDHRLTALL